MFLFKRDSNKLAPLGHVPFKDEKEVKDSISADIPELFGAVLLEKEFQIKGGRIDALAYHPKTQTLLIIEYKANLPHFIHRDNPIIQIISYGKTFRRSLHKDSEFHDEVAKLIKSKTDRQVTPRQQNIRLIALKPFQEGAPPFTDEDIDNAEEGDGGRKVELYGVQRFENDFLFVQQFPAQVKTKAALNTPPANTPFASLSKTTTSPQPRGQYDEPYFTDRMIPEVRQAYEKYRDAIEAMCQPHDLVPVYNKNYVSFKAQGKFFVGVVRKVKQLQVYVKADKLVDTHGLTGMPLGTIISGDCSINNAEKKDFDQVMGLIRQAYDKRVLGASSQAKDKDQHFTDRMDTEVYEKYKKYKVAIEELCQLNSLEFDYHKYYINFKSNNQVFCSVTAQAHTKKLSSLQFNLKLKENELSDVHGLTRLMTKSHLGPGSYDIKNAEKKDFDQVMALIRQAYDKRVLGA